jgi:hypothetical protein
MPVVNAAEGTHGACWSCAGGSRGASLEGRGLAMRDARGKMPDKVDGDELRRFRRRLPGQDFQQPLTGARRCWLLSAAGALLSGPKPKQAGPCSPHSLPGSAQPLARTRAFRRGHFPTSRRSGLASIQRVHERWQLAAGCWHSFIQASTTPGRSIASSPGAANGLVLISFVGQMENISRTLHHTQLGGLGTR